MSIIALVLAALFGIVALVLLFIVVRNPILVRIALRNLPRRPAQSVLIIVGMMLATVIISSAFTTGDSISHSIERNAKEDLRFMDQLVRVDPDSPRWKTEPLPDRFSESAFETIGPALRADPDIDGVLPAVVENVAVVNLRGRQFEVRALLTGLDPASTAGFGELRDRAGNLVTLEELDPDEVYIDAEGAEEIDSRAGDLLGVALGPEEGEPLTVRAVVDGWFFKRQVTTVVLMMSLARAQELLGREGMLDRVLVSNRGDVNSGEPLTEGIQDRLADLPAIRDAGLELVPLKSDIVDIANRFASVFVTIFTVFGLFSIGVGILLIFLIFSMLAAERKSEMGMSRAVGMQRHHLVRMFVAEGTFYGLGAAVIGAIIGVGVGFLLVIGVASAFSQGAGTQDFVLTPAVTLRSVLVSFFAGSIVTFLTVLFAARRISRLNIVRAIRDVPEPQLARASRSTLVWGIVLAFLGLVIAFAGVRTAQLTPFGLGASLLPIGVAMVLRWLGVPQRWVLSLVGVYLLVFWLLPRSVFDAIQDWHQDFSIFFVSGALVVTGAVLLATNNSGVLVSLATAPLARARRLLPMVKSAVSYPLRSSFRTGVSVAMFAVVIFSIVVMSNVTTAFNKLLEDQDRLAGGYQVIAFSPSDLNPVDDLAASVDADLDLSFVTRVDGVPSVGTLRTIFDAKATLTGDVEQAEDALITGVDDDFIHSNKYIITLATEEFIDGSGFDSTAVWEAVRDTPGLAIASADLFPTLNNFSFDNVPGDFRLDVDGLLIENDSMEPVPVTVVDRESGTSFQVSVIAAVDDFGFFLPQGLFTSSRTFVQELPREVEANRFFFNVDSGTGDAASKIEVAFFEHGLDSIDIQETLDDSNSARNSVNNLLIGFMALGLVVGIAALGVVSARAVVERRHDIGVMRAIGFSRGMVQFTFLLESSFIALLGIGMGLVLGLATSINVINDIRNNEPDVRLVVPWLRIATIAVGAYLFSLLTTYLPARQAGRIAPADALRYA